MALRDTNPTPADLTRPGDDGRVTAKPYVRSKLAAAANTSRPRRDRETATKEVKSVSTRLSPAEGEALEALKDRHGFSSNSDALRALIRSASGMLEADPATTGSRAAPRHRAGLVRRLAGGSRRTATSRICFSRSLRERLLAREHSREHRSTSCAARTTIWTSEGGRP